MLKRPGLVIALCVGLSVPVLPQTPTTAPGAGARRVALGDWPEARGPNRDGISTETALPDSWNMKSGLLWRAPFGGRSAPIVMGNRVYVQNPSGSGPALQERVMALDADSGKVIWEYKFNIFQSDVPPHRVGWASPAADPETGNVYALGVGASVIALSAEGKLLWQRSVGEEFAAFTTHGGRTMSPIIDGELVIVSAAVSSWGTQANRAHRIIALDKRTGEIVYVANPGGRPHDTAYAAPTITTISGVRLLIVGLGDGAIHAIKAQTGEKVWSFVATKRGINTGVVVSGSTVIISHGDENLSGNEMGMIAAIDGSQTGDIKTTKWSHYGEQFGFSSPLLDGPRVYQIENGSRLKAYDVETGKELWTQPLGTSQKAPPVMADGKIFVGTENGKFMIVRPHADRAEILSDVELPISKNSIGGSEGTAEQVFGGAAISRGRVFFVSSDAVYAIGPKQRKTLTGWAINEPAVTGEGAPAYVQVSPTELVLTPGQTVKLSARSFDSRGRFLREEQAVWSLDGLKGTVTDGAFSVGPERIEQAGLIKATVGVLTGEARARVARPLPWEETFESMADKSVPPGWVNAGGPLGPLAVTTMDGQKVLQKTPTNTLFKRGRVFIGPVEWSNYTMQADVSAPTRRRMMADVGITVQRYSLVLYGTTQKLKLEPWEPETQRSVTVPFAWKADAWYTIKLRVENLPNGAVRARGKAWPKGEPEPATWQIDKTDPIGNRNGAPGFFIDAEFGANIDNVKLTANE
ncbi:MAG TPA: PQQ-binding-like beta-propeller repeat protein [Vicinamibacterales bacterium]|nr:PQQ-binding-like beta-propeller repeat protein [Vicinamibacterales bacterium]